MIEGRLATARSFGERIYGKTFGTLSYQERVALTKDYLLYLIGEVDEVLRELDWKAHRSAAEPFNRDNLLEELIDIYKYWLGVLALWGFTGDEVDGAFWRKTEVVERRFVQEQELKATTKPIAIVDIDGVLADYPASFERYVAREMGSLERADGRLRALWKRRYRNEGVEGAGAEPRPAAQAFMQGLQGLDCYLVALTSRPYGKHKRLFYDTASWFVQHRIPVDFIAFEADKDEFVLRLLDQGKQVVLFVDDDARHVEKVAALGVRAILFQGCSLLDVLMEVRLNGVGGG